MGGQLLLNLARLAHHLGLVLHRCEEIRDLLGGDQTAVLTLKRRRDRLGAHFLLVHLDDVLLLFGG